MKKILTSLGVALGSITLMSCAPADWSHDLKEIEITSTVRTGYEHGEVQHETQYAFESPTRIAVFSDTVLDILYEVGAFESDNPLDLEMIMVARRQTHPMEQFRESNIHGINIFDGGQLHLPNVNAIELHHPQVVFMDGRSFIDSPDGTLANLRERIPYARFINLNFVANPGGGMGPVSLLGDTTLIVNGLRAIFPVLADDLTEGLDEIENAFNDISNTVSTLNDGQPASALWVTLNTIAGGSTSVGLNGFNSRWRMIHDEFGFNYLLEDNIAAANIEEVLIEESAIAQADFIFLFAHPNAPDAAIDEFINHPFITSLDTTTIIKVYRPAWHTAPGGFSATRIMIQDVLSAI